MTTATPSRPAPPRPSAPRPRPAPASHRGASIDPFRVLRRHLLLLIAATFLGGGLGVGAFFLLNMYYPLYSGQVVFEVRPGVREVTDVGAQQALKDDDVGQIANTQLVLLASREVLTAAMSDPDVQNKTDWFLNAHMTTGTPEVENSVDDMIQALDPSVVRGTMLFQVSWSAHRADDVPIVLNAVARAYMDKRASMDNAVHNENLDLFRSQLRETNLLIRDLETETHDFIRDSNITSLQDPRYHELSLAVESLVNQITSAQQSLSFANSRYSQVLGKLEGTLEPGDDDILKAEMDPSVATHIGMENSLKYQLRVIGEKYRGGHPAIHEAESRLRAAEAERRSTTEEIIKRNLHADLKMLSQQRESYVRMLDELEIENEEKGKQLTELAAQQSRYQALVSQREYLEKGREADTQLIKQIELMKLRPDAHRVDIAQFAQTPRERSFPKSAIIVPLGVVLVLGLTIGIIFLREITDQRVKSASDLMVLPGARLVGVIPDLDDDPTKCEAAELVVRRFPNSVLAESYRQAVTPVLKAVDRDGHQTLVLIGGLPGAGTTCAASNLAAACAAAGRSVLLIDANFRRPRLAEVMGVEPEHVGLGDVLTGAAELDDAIVESESGVSVMPAGTPASRVIERLNTEAFDQTIAQLRGRFGLIVFDAPPAVVAGDAMVLASKLDAAVLMVRANQEQRGLVARLIRQLTDTNCELIGIVLNRPRGTAGGYFKKNYATMAEYATKKS